ncbi:MAG: sugar phosphate isomerase/epimerase [Bryobacteraceae bacterium]
MSTYVFSRRGFIAACAASPLILTAKTNIPVGLELYSVRNELKEDLPGTLKAVSGDGYQCVEFFAPYHDWTVDYARDVRKMLDQTNLRCFSTHNNLDYFNEDQIGKTIELNGALGSRYAIVASAGKPDTLDGWKAIAAKLNQASERLASHHLRVGYHNHELEFTPLNGTRPMEILARNTNHDVVLQLDVGTCVQAGSDPVAWIKQNPGRIRSIHCKDWSPKQGYRVLLGEGVAPWKAIFSAAESVGGVEYYLVEQEGSRYSEFETAKLCLESFKKLHGESQSAT